MRQQRTRFVHTLDCPNVREKLAHLKRLKYLKARVDRNIDRKTLKLYCAYFNSKSKHEIGIQLGVEELPRLEQPQRNRRNSFVPFSSSDEVNAEAKEDEDARLRASNQKDYNPHPWKTKKKKKGRKGITVDRNKSHVVRTFDKGNQIAKSLDGKDERVLGINPHNHRGVVSSKLYL